MKSISLFSTVSFVVNASVSLKLSWSHMAPAEVLSCHLKSNIVYTLSIELNSVTAPPHRTLLRDCHKGRAAAQSNGKWESSSPTGRAPPLTLLARQLPGLLFTLLRFLTQSHIICLFKPHHFVQPDSTGRIFEVIHEVTPISKHTWLGCHPEKGIGGT